MADKEDGGIVEIAEENNGESKSVPAKKTANIVLKVISFVVLGIALLIVIFTVITIVTVGRENGIFGYRGYIVLSDSMSDTFSAGDLVISKSVTSQEAEDLEDGTIITFISTSDESYGQTVTHKIRSKTIKNGRTAYITYGTATGTDDSEPCYASNVLGTYSFSVPKLGYFFNFIKTPAGYAVVILIPFLLILGGIAFNFIVTYKKYRKLKAAEAAEALEKEEAERVERENAAAEAERMRRELEELKAKLAEKDEKPPE